MQSVNNFLLQHANRTVGVIVPVFNERAEIENLTRHLASLGVEQTIIVDGGSTDQTREWLLGNWQEIDQGKLLLQSAPGRALQMNVGAANASSDILLFLHADSRLPSTAKQEVLRARERQNLWGRFDIVFNNSVDSSQKGRLAMRVIALFINIRSRLTGIATGDQAIFVDHQLFSIIGGYPQLPLMEDIALSRTLKRHCVPHCSSLKVSTSARRWEQNGVIRTVLQMWYFRLAYFFGIAPQRLAKKYRQIR